ncbi:MAG: PorT family protein [Cyclobacteriaceae bacterium]|jgi:hypothetical protein|nr:PorT family protein [Cyclobacteriaceae bacterium]
MKKILFIALLLSGSTLLMAQTFIPKAGVSLAKVSISDDIKNEFYSDPSISYKTGFIVGLAVQFPISDMISIQPELLYHQKGYKLSDEFDGLNYNETVTLNYLELPIMVNFAFGNFYANAGPFLAYGLGGKYKLEYSAQGDTETFEGDVKFGDEPDDPGDDWYVDVPLEYGLAIGAGYKLFDKILIDARYGLGLSSIYTDEDNFEWTTKNSTIQITIAYPIVK